jgi:hypothetical protein
VEGKQGQGLKAPSGTLTVESLEPPAPRAVRLEGAGFYLHGRVRVAAALPEAVHAIVRGSRPFDVLVAVGDDGRVVLACDCITFRDRPSVCRHIWATLIMIHNESMLAPVPPKAAVQ